MKTLSLTLRNFKEIHRDPVSILLGIAMPTGLLIIFESIQKKLPLEIFSAQNLTPALTVFGSTFLMMFSATLLNKDRQSEFLTRLLSAPLKSSNFITSYFIAFIPFILLQVLVSLIVGTLFGANFQNILFSLLVFLPTGLISVGLGLTMGALLNVGQISAFGSIFITAMGLFSGAWIDLRQMGGIFEKVGYAFPYAHAVDASKAILSDSFSKDVYTNMLWVGVYFILFLGICIWSFHYKTKR